MSVRLPLLWGGEATAVLDDRDVLPITYERLGEDHLAAMTVPSGIHRVELRRLPAVDPQAE